MFEHHRNRVSHSDDAAKVMRSLNSKSVCEKIHRAFDDEGIICPVFAPIKKESTVRLRVDSLFAGTQKGH